MSKLLFLYYVIINRIIYLIIHGIAMRGSGVILELYEANQRSAIILMTIFTEVYAIFPCTNIYLLLIQIDGYPILPPLQICNFCRTVLGLRWTALCGVQCMSLTSNSREFNACTTIWRFRGKLYSPFQP